MKEPAFEAQINRDASKKKKKIKFEFFFSFEQIRIYKAIGKSGPIVWVQFKVSLKVNKKNIKVVRKKMQKFNAFLNTQNQSWRSKSCPNVWPYQTINWGWLKQDQKAKDETFWLIFFKCKNQ